VKKRLNRFALTLWLLAVVVIVLDAGALFLTREAMKQLAATRQDTETFYVVAHFGKTLLEELGTVAMLAGLGVIVELLDQIRWNALQRDK
jgi:hypothetical protein